MKVRAMYTTSQAALARVISEHALLEMRRRALLEERTNLDSCNHNTQNDMHNQTTRNEYRSLVARIVILEKQIIQCRNALLPTPHDVSCLRPGLRASFCVVDRDSGKSLDSIVRHVDVGVGSEFYLPETAHEVPVYGAQCRQIRPFIGKSREFCSELPGLDRAVDYVKLIEISRPPFALAA